MEKIDKIETTDRKGNVFSFEITEEPLTVGKYEGIFEIDGDLLKLNLVAAGEHDRPVDLDQAVIYRK